jgi:hypothetical protein
MADPPGDDLVKDVFAHYGLAAYMAQVMERSIVNALISVYGPDETKLSQRDLDRRAERLSRRTQSALLEQLRQAGLSTEIMPDLRAALADRNRLTHHFFWDHALDFITVAGCERMRDILIAMEHRFRTCSDRVETEVQGWAASHGISPEDRDAVHQAMVESGRLLSAAEISELTGSRSAQTQREEIEPR